MGKRNQNRSKLWRRSAHRKQIRTLTAKKESGNRRNELSDAIDNSSGAAQQMANGYSAAEGGTMLRNALKNLYTPTDKTKSTLRELGVESADSNGKPRNVQDILQDLGGALGGLNALVSEGKKQNGEEQSE